MIDLTPLDVRNKRGDFKRILRGYEPQEVDTFLELVAERLESIVRENLGLRERTQILQQQVDQQSGREQAVHEALVTAQELRADIRAQAQREADHLLKEAQTEARRMMAEAEADVRTRLRSIERQIDQGSLALQDLERRRARFLRAFRQLLEREMDGVEVEESKPPLEERAIDLDLGARRFDPDLAGSEVVPPPLPPPLPEAAMADTGAADARAEEPGLDSSAPGAPTASPETMRAASDQNLLFHLDPSDGEGDEPGR